MQYANNMVNSSITYAGRIQSAVLPDIKELDDFLENFILYNPRDVVSGDFYWYRIFEHKLVITAADCTGHGIPGAFVSMLGMSLLNEIVNEKIAEQPASLLSELRIKMKNSLNQNDGKSRQKDGIDMALCVIDTKNLSVSFAGANNPLYLVRNGNLTVYKGVKNPVGVYLREKEFQSIELRLQKGDMLYLFSDGYADQFGGPKFQKYNLKRFKQSILDVADYPVNKQKELLSKRFKEWKGTKKQIDDILIIGLKI